MATPSYVATFIHEAEDLLGGIEAAVLALEGAPGDRELIDQLFRAFHTLKGSAGVAGLSAIAQFTHHVESALDGVRSGAIAPTPALVSAALAAKDHVARLLAAATSGPACDPAPPGNARSSGDAIVGALAAMLPGAPSHAGASGPGAASTLAFDEPATSDLLVDYLVTFTPSADPAQLAALDIDPAALVDELRGLGA
ncbi:MAG TPA: Hpt domain-containing protein, partial [Kofleriaceae bacterium]|nr:Hpt domain-containing protein [Kofleriaceae bacterium]